MQDVLKVDFRSYGYEEELSLVILEHEHGADLQDLLERCSDYSVASFGIPTAPADAQSQYLAGLDVVDPSRKRLIGVYSSTGAMIAFVDQLFGYPEVTDVALGLIAVDPKHRSRSLGTALLKGVEQEARELGFLKVVVFCQMAENALSSTFWTKHHYREVRRESIHVVASIARERIIFEREVS